jgi:hypothetical protein
VPLSLWINPAVHVQRPPWVHAPFVHPQVEGSLSALAGFMHLPEPEIPSSHSAHPSGHFLHCGPKNADRHRSQEGPVNPGGQRHIPEGVQVLWEEQGGEQEVD